MESKIYIFILYPFIYNIARSKKCPNISFKEMYLVSESPSYLKFKKSILVLKGLKLINLKKNLILGPSVQI